MAKVNKTTKATEPIIVHDLTLVAPDRTPKDIGKLKESITAAEAIHYPNRVQLYDLYHDVLSVDGYLRGIKDKRIKSVLNKRIKFVDKEGKEIRSTTDAINSKAGREVINQIMQSLFWGVSGMEFVVGDEFKVVEIERKHIKPEKGLITRSQYGLSPQDGYVIDDLPFVWVVGNPKDLGLLLPCSMYSIYKRGNYGDWAQYIEIFGHPVRVIYYDAYDTKTKEELRKILNETGSSLAMMLPKQAQFEMKDGKSSNGDGKLQDLFRGALNDEMAICVLGNTETTTSSTSSGYAQSKEHGEQQDEITAADLIFVEQELNSAKFLGILASYGLDVNGKFEFELELNLAKLKLRLEIDSVVCKIVPIADDYWYKTYGITKPDNYDELKAKMESSQQAVQAPEPPEPVDPKSKKPVAKKPVIKPEEDSLAVPMSYSLRRRIFTALADFFDRAQH